MRIQFLTSYHDRYGVDHERGDFAEYNEGLALKLIRFRTAIMAKPSPAVIAEKEIEPEPDIPKPKQRSSSRSFSPKKG